MKRFLINVVKNNTIISYLHITFTIELINAVSGLSFNEIWENKVTGEYGLVTVSYISLNNLLINKKASGRPQDIADFEELKNLFNDHNNPNTPDSSGR